MPSGMDDDPKHDERKRISDNRTLSKRQVKINEDSGLSVKAKTTFSSLPTEIQQLIMDFLLPEPRVLRARFVKSESSGYQAYLHHMYNKYDEDFKDQALRVTRLGRRFEDLFLSRYKVINQMDLEFLSLHSKPYMTRYGTTYRHWYHYVVDVRPDTVILYAEDMQESSDDDLNSDQSQLPTSLRSIGMYVGRPDRQSLRNTMNFIERNAPHIKHLIYVVGDDFSMLGEPKLLVLDEWMEDAITLEGPSIGRTHPYLDTSEKALYNAKIFRKCFAAEVGRREKNRGTVAWRSITFEVSVLAELWDDYQVQGTFPVGAAYFLPAFQIWLPYNGGSRLRGIYDGMEEMFCEDNK